MAYSHMFIAEELPPYFSEQELKERFEKFQRGDLKAREELIEHNIRLVLMEASKYNWLNLDKQDIVARGMLGLIHGVDSFKLNMNVSFSTYACKCIENEIHHLVRHESKHQEVRRLSDPIKNGRDEDDRTLEDILPDDDFDLDSIVDNEFIHQKIWELIGHLPERERHIVVSYFYDQKSMPQIGEELGVTRQAISISLKRTLLRLRRQILIRKIIPAPVADHKKKTRHIRQYQKSTVSTNKNT